MATGDRKYQWGTHRPFNDFGSHMRKRFNGLVQKVSIDAGFTCPNRDGSKGFGGCTFCNNETFKPVYSQASKTVSEQLKTGISLFEAKHPGTRYLAYFQAYTNTYGEISKLIELYEEALAFPGVIGLIVGTRPDCLPDHLLDYFEELSRKCYVAIELGIESTKDETLNRVNRGHGFQSSIDAIHRIASRNIPVGAHMILGLPGETKDDILGHAPIVSELPLSYLKLHQLQYVRGSKLGREYLKNPENFKVFELEEYVDLVVEFVVRLRPGIVLERFSSQSPYYLLIAPAWKLKNHELSHLVEKRLQELNLWQGKYYNAELDSIPQISRINA